MRKIVSLVFFGFIINSSALDIELASEGPCKDQPAFKDLKSLSLDSSWVTNSSMLIYNPLLSYYEMYRYAEDLYHRKSDDITDRELKNLCPTYVIEMGAAGMTMGLIGVGGLYNTYEVKTGQSGEMLWRLKGDADYSERTFVTKTGPGYFVAVTCWKSGQRSFSLNKMSSTITDAEKQDVIEHVKTFGFVNPKYYFSYNYEGCGKSVQKNYCMRNCLEMSNMNSSESGSMISRSLPMSSESRPMMSESRPLMSNSSHPMISKSHSVISQNHSMISKNHSMISKNHTVKSDDGSLNSESHSMNSESHSTNSESHSVISDNHSEISDNQSVVSENQSVFSDNHSVISNSHSVISKTHPYHF